MLNAINVHSCWILLSNENNILFLADGSLHLDNFCIEIKVSSKLTNDYFLLCTYPLRGQHNPALLYYLAQYEVVTTNK